MSNYIIETVKLIQKKAGGQYSVNTIIHYWSLSLKYRAYRKMGHSKMESYEFTGQDAGCDARVVMRARKLFEELKIC